MCSQALLGACAHRVPSPTRRGDAAAPPAVRFQGGRKSHVSAPVTRSDRRLAAPLPALPVSNQVAGVGGLLVPAPPDRRLLARWPTEGDLFTTRAGVWLWVDKCTDRPVWHATAETGKGMKAEPGCRSTSASGPASVASSLLARSCTPKVRFAGPLRRRAIGYVRTHPVQARHDHLRSLVEIAASESAVGLERGSPISGVARLRRGPACCRTLSPVPAQPVVKAG